MRSGMPSVAASSRIPSTSSTLCANTWNSRLRRIDPRPRRRRASTSSRQLSTTRARRPRTRYCSYVSCVAPSTETVSSLSPLATRRSRPRAIERHGEVRVDRRRDAARARHLEHVVDVRVQERLAPVEELHLEEVVAELVEEAAVELEGHERARAADLARAGEAVRAAEVARARRLDDQAGGERPEPGPAALVLGAVQVVVEATPPRQAIAAERRQREELTPRERDRTRGASHAREPF